HDQRHQSASDMRRDGADMMEVQTQLRHKTPKQTQRYTEIQPDEKRRASERLDKFAGTLKSWSQFRSHREKVAR
ncbi:MAG: tyrosine-type recombinase/integrase, partial [Acidobacteria bacterium]|nr:tyrosine-type recombinase/integrase [Acidobacteriota bacterium]